MKRGIVIATAVVSLGCSGVGSIPPEATTPDGLQQVAFYGVFGAYAKRDARLVGYRRVHLEEGTLGYQSAPRYPRGRRLSSLAPASTAELSVEDEARLWRHFREVFTREFQARSPFAVSDDVGPETLTIRAHILDLVVRVSGTSSGAESRFSRRSVVFTVVLDVRDSVTDEPLARIVDRRGTVARNSLTRQVGAAVDSAGLRQQMFRWARALRRHLERLRV